MKDLYQEVTDRIISELESGIIPWEKPWTGVNSGAVSHVTGKPYSLLNQILLNKPGEYITFDQCRKQGGKVKKGAKSKFVVFWKVLFIERKDKFGNLVKDNEGNTVEDPVPVLRYFNVFHIDDCEGIKPKFDKPLPSTHAEPLEAAEAALKGYVTRSNVRLINRKPDRAFYDLMSDKIVLPLMEQFTDSAEYYSTAFHEATHSTGHKSRLNRFSENLADNIFGSESYSKEELVAEIGAACILNTLGIETKSTFRNSAGYIQNWLRALRNDKRLIVSAASRAEKAVKMILNTEIAEQKQAA